MSFIDFLLDSDVVVDDLPKEVVVEVLQDSECDMAMITVHGTSVYGGNYCDFYDGCYSHPDIGNFDNIDELIEIIERELIELGHDVVIEYGNYVYDE